MGKSKHWFIVITEDGWPQNFPPLNFTLHRHLGGSVHATRRRDVSPQEIANRLDGCSYYNLHGYHPTQLYLHSNHLFVFGEIPKRDREGDTWETPSIHPRTTVSLYCYRRVAYSRTKSLLPNLVLSGYWERMVQSDANCRVGQSWGWKAGAEVYLLGYPTHDVPNSDDSDSN